jgi:hypothetical protein
MMSKRLFFRLLILGLFIYLGQLCWADFSTPSKNISNTPAVDSKYPKVVHTPGTGDVYVIWIETDGSNDHLYFSKSTDYAETWTTPLQLTLSGQILQQLNLADDSAYSMAVTPPYIHIVFQWRANISDDFEIIYLRSSDLGETIANWDVWLQLTDNATPSMGPDVAVSGEYVHVTYGDTWPGGNTIMYKRINGYGGGTMDLTRRLTFSGSALSPRIAVGNSGACVSIVYEDLYSGQWNIFYKHIEDSGAGVYQTRQLTFCTTDWNGRADISAGSGTYEQYIYIVYECHWPGNRDIMYKRIDNYGHSPYNVYTARLTYSATDSYSCAIDYDTVYGAVHITYYDYWTGTADVMYRGFMDGGGGGFNGLRVSWGIGDSAHPAIAASGSWAYIVWHDYTSGNYEIYIKYGLGL